MESGDLAHWLYPLPDSDACGFHSGKYPAGYGFDHSHLFGSPCSEGQKERIKNLDQKNRNRALQNPVKRMLRRPAFCIYCVLPVADADGFDGNASAADHFNVVEFFFHQADHGIIFS